MQLFYSHEVHWWCHGCVEVWQFRFRSYGNSKGNTWENWNGVRQGTCRIQTFLESKAILFMQEQVTVSKDATVTIDGADDKGSIVRRSKQVCFASSLDFVYSSPRNLLTQMDNIVVIYCFNYRSKVKQSQALHPTRNRG